jgi:hypothetical protein
VAARSRPLAEAGDFTESSEEQSLEVPSALIGMDSQGRGDISNLDTSDLWNVTRGEIGVLSDVRSGD